MMVAESVERVGALLHATSSALHASSAIVNEAQTGRGMQRV